MFELTGFSVCDFMKMDVEGENVAILRGSRGRGLCRIHAMAMEWHASMEQVDEIQKHLHGIGFHTPARMGGHATRQLMLKAWQG